MCGERCACKMTMSGADFNSLVLNLYRPLRTFNTAVVYFLKFRLLHPDSMGYIVGHNSLSC